MLVQPGQTTASMQPLQLLPPRLLSSLIMTRCSACVPRRLGLPQAPASIALQLA
jgi:hypothetical protein